MADPGAGTRPRCAVVIPTYNGAALTRACLRALLSSPPAEVDWQLIVVDDGSADDTAAEVASFGEAVTFVQHERNQGFSRSCNDGALAAGPSCDYVVFLNNDTVPVAGWLDRLVECARERPAAAAVGAKLLFPNGTIQHAGLTITRDGWPRHLYAGFPGNHEAVSRTRKMAAVTGACMLVRAEDFERMGGFDEEFVNGYEDVDLCHRLTAAGREVWYCAESLVYHLESVTRWPTGRPEAVEGNMALYAERWGSVPADDFEYYVADGLLTAEYGAYDPFTLEVSPQLALVRAEGSLERALLERSRQVMEMQALRTRAALQGLRTVEPGPHRPAPPERIEGELLHEGAPRRLPGRRPRHLISVLLPVKNQERDVLELLPSIFAQRAPAEIEIVAVDSGSRDGTVEALREAGATVVSIDPAEFNHGLARNLAASYAKGDMLLFVSGRSRPDGDGWLAPLLDTLDGDPQAAGACSRVLPREDADLLTRRDGERELSASGERERKVISDWKVYTVMGEQERRVFLNFHTVSALLRADVFAANPFRAMTTIGEDLLWSREVIEAGHSLWHEPASVVHHSHPYTFSELFSRNVDDGVANAEINGRSLAEQDVLPAIRAMVADDWAWLRRELGLEGHELEREELDAVLRRTAQVVGQWVGVNHGELPVSVVNEFSGVHRARRVQ